MTNVPSAINLYKGLSIYRVGGSSKWYVRIWDRRTKKYLVKSTGEDSSIKARAAAQELALSLLRSEPLIESRYTFRHFALKLLHKARIQGKAGDRSDGYVKSIHWAIQNEDWGLLRHFGEMDVRQLKTNTYQDYIAQLEKKRPDLSSSSKNTLMAAFRNVLKIARDEGVIDNVPATPRARVKDVDCH